MHLLEATGDFRDHFAFCVDRYPVNNLYQQVDQTVNDRPAPLPTKSGQQCVTNGFGVTTELVDRLG
jgi:hypothetical protein